MGAGVFIKPNTTQEDVSNPSESADKHYVEIDYSSDESRLRNQMEAVDIEQDYDFDEGELDEDEVKDDGDQQDVCEMEGTHKWDEGSELEGERHEGQKYGWDEDSEHELGDEGSEQEGEDEGSEQEGEDEGSEHEGEDEGSEHEMCGEGSEHEVGVQEVSMILGVCGEEVSMRWGGEESEDEAGDESVSEEVGANDLDGEKDQPTLQPSTSLIVLFKESKNVMEILCCHALRQHCTH